MNAEKYKKECKGSNEADPFNNLLVPSSSSMASSNHVLKFTSEVRNAESLGRSMATALHVDISFLSVEP